MTHAVLATIAAFLNTEGGDLLIGVADDRTVLGIDHDRLGERRRVPAAPRPGRPHRASATAPARASSPRTQIVAGTTVCLVSCQRGPEPVYLLWNGLEKAAEGDLYVRSGPNTVRLDKSDVAAYLATRFGSP